MRVCSVSVTCRGKANNAPLGAALAVSSMFIVGGLSLLIFLGSRRVGRVAGE